MNISAVAKEMSISPSTIRYYESINLLPPITRNESGVRTFSEEDLKWVDFIACMRSAGLPLEILKRYADLVRSGDETLEERKQILIEEKEQLKKKKEEIEQVINRLNYKIEDYEGKLLAKEQKMI
ncbi:MerR family transcriptional regulator [Alkalibacterium olivapovliticus]|uniref:DNA-binding transcriptional MerR regulator n=1 Tax=Alkalibacterium olivapovliticus TaxID=99907 RepID=A0A2T0VTG6_9LACT|nr:MerR family transcriptional regulator [Alkalibacterium olivapovliticus]MCC5895390.1 MerR family transcriptional regulator [Alkalibacterium sp.]PRY74479.1 DNA-binding transcriptional MerR regulator [Alkalibacterium olivapovliticus]